MLPTSSRGYDSLANTPLHGDCPGTFPGMSRALRFAACAFAAGTLVLGGTNAFSDSADGIAFFESKIRPVLAERCFECHSAQAKKLKGGLLLDTREGVLKGGESGPALVPGKPEESLIIKAVRRLDKDLSMPPKQELTAQQIENFIAWVKMGAPDPRTSGAPQPAAAASAQPAKIIDYAGERKKWAFHKPERPAVPSAQFSVLSAQSDAAKTEHLLSTTPPNPIDAFILQKLRAADLTPAPPADPRTLIRRMTFDLTGLPPTPEEVDAFIRDWPGDSDAASIQNRKSKIENLIDRLLASPHYGERWGRHWLDTVRYADSLDSRGEGKEGDILDAWRYRDWVVNAFNRDMPYDEFIVQQVAGDILAAREWDGDKVVATGLYAIGNWGNGDADKEKVYTDIVDDQIDVTGRVFLGLTLGCARCHDHKFDPITTADYYSLAGIFFSSHIIDKFAPKTAGEKLMRIALLSPAEQSKRDVTKRRLAAVEAQLASGLRPLTEVQRDFRSKPGLVAWKPKNAEFPLLVINTTDADISFLTIKLPAHAISLHPGPNVNATAAWKSPLAGNVSVSVRLRDADPNCGDGITWAVRRGAQTLGSGEMDNGGAVDFSQTEIAVESGDLVQLVIGPRKDHKCDTTQIEFVVRAHDGREWHLREALADGAAQGHESGWWICSGGGERLAQDDPKLAALEAERRQLATQLAPPQSCQGLQEGGIMGTAYAGFHDARIHVRGRYDRLGDLRPRAFPALLAGENQAPLTEGSGRLQLAHWLASADNPLTARVMVNRIWQHHFGEGIVRTANNFGKLGTPPTHPELLDWLAVEFVKSGWSVKAMHRLIMMSEVYQRSGECSVLSAQFSVADAANERALSSEHWALSTEHLQRAKAVDPENTLLARFPRRRLSAEELRDAMLVAAGKLDRTLGGPSVKELDAPRRTLYVKTIRSERATYQMLFDGADPNTIVEKRTDSTVAPQALWLLNHPFALAQARALAESVAHEASPETDGRIAWLYERLFARPPQPEEIRTAGAAIARLGGNETAWEQLCQVLLCSNEFAYVD
jgi:uncharacterized protein DUF1553/uncharacterized protein DUF1549/cytochrome c